MGTKFTIDGYAQLELNNVAFRRDGRIEAQCALSTEDFTDAAPAEVGMILAVDKVNNMIKLPVEGDNLPRALHYSTEHMYDERKLGLKDFCLKPGEFHPRMGYLAIGDLFTTNCLAYEGYADEAALMDALKVCHETAVFGKEDATGRICLVAEKPASGLVFKVAKYYTMPNGTPGVKLQVISC